ncbi:MAG: hypothetical protein BGO68_03345 [Candidatus Amoebophilus sp. 36-38]|nr:MAG: hypothetical protein BGO68_03345 [Candidatus Amoebophilus sp. 36-38]
MTNIIKKMKNVNMFTKLVGLAAIFSVVSCGCDKDKDAKEFLKVTFTDETKKGEAIKVTLKAEGGDVKVEDYKIKVVKAEMFKGDDYNNAETDAKEIAKVKIKQEGQTLKDAGITELKKDGAKDLSLEVENTSASVNSVKFTISIEKDGKAIESAKEKVVKWTKKA